MAPPQDPTRIDCDPSTGRPILIAPRRRERPIQTAGKDDAELCPFCPGAERETPPERDAIRDPGTEPDQPGWRVRAFPNLYPAAPWHEVIVEGASHRTQPGQLGRDRWADVLCLWRRRIAWFESQPSIRCAFLFKNVGRFAGASIHHNHSQVLGLPMLPPRLAIELEHSKTQCHTCAEIDNAAKDGRVIAAGEQHLWITPRFSKFPYESWVVPRDHNSDFLDAETNPELAALLNRAFAGIATTLDRPPLNSYLHRIPGADFHWHLEIQPRTGFLAGLELGGDMYINSISGAEVAAQLRDSPA